MNFIINILYMVTLGVIRVWRMFTSVIIYIWLEPLKECGIRRLIEAGIEINGSQPHDIIVHNDGFYHRVMNEGTLGVGESYIDGWWDCEKLDECLARIIRSGFYKEIVYPWEKVMHYLQFRVFNLQTAARSWQVAEKHYNLGNELFKSFLDKSMTYSCGYWKDAKNLEEAQEHKMELIGRKLKLEPGMRVLDFGCGWGGLCKYLAETYKVQVVGITNSIECAKEAKERCTGLLVEIRVQDYRDINEGFDRIVSVEMFEHVGRQNYRTFFKIVDRCLSDEGIFLLHTIGIDNDFVPETEPFSDKYMFANGILPDHKNIPESIHNLFCIEDWHNFGQYYDQTLMAWYANFVKNWPTISRMFKDQKYFYRMWTYYYSMNAGLYRARKFQLWQIVLTKRGLPGGYISVR